MGKSQGTAYVLKMKKQANLASKISSLEHTNMQSEERLCSKTFFSFFPSYFFPSFSSSFLCTFFFLFSLSSSFPFFSFSTQDSFMALAVLFVAVTTPKCTCNCLSPFSCSLFLLIS